MAVSTIALIIYFILVALAQLGIYAAPGVIVGIVAAVVAIALLVEQTLTRRPRA